MTRWIGNHGVASQRWTPTILGTDLVAWFDATLGTAITSDANGVSEWRDKSSNLFHATQTTNANKPSYASERVSFDGGDWLDSSAGASNISRCVGAVVRYSSTASSEAITAMQSGTGAWGFGRKSTGNADGGRQMFIAKTGVTNIGVTTAKLANDVDAVVLGNTTSSAWRISINGTAETGSHSQTLTAGRLLRIGAEGTFAPISGSMREIVICSELSTANQQRLEGYLAWRWGLNGSLPSGHPYKNYAP